MNKKGESTVSGTYENSKLRLSVPDDWNVYQGTDLDGNENPKKLMIYKYANDPLTILSRAGMTVVLFEKNQYYMSTKGFYDNVCDIEPFTLGREWNGYTCTSLGYPYTMLEAREDGCVLQVMILTKNGDYSISLEDEDVKNIISGIEIVRE